MIKPNLKLLCINLAFLFPSLTQAQFTGDLDPTFGQTGTLVYDHLQAGTEDYLFDLVADPATNLIYSVGRTEVADTGKALIYCVDENGNPNSQFGTNGASVFTPALGTYNQFNAVDIDADGKIVVAGSITNASLDILVARYNSDGTPDLSFNSTGYHVIDGNAQLLDNATSIKVLSSGKILVGGTEGLALDSTFSYLDSTQMWIGCFNPDGTLDASFGNNGVTTVDFNSKKGEIYALAEMPNGNILVGGSAGDPAALAMLTVNGSPQTTFSGDGKLTIMIGNFMFIQHVSTTSTGKILITGDVFLSNGDVEGFVRMLNTDGTPDGSFANGNFQSDIDPIVPNYELSIRDAVELPNGQILCSGGTWTWGGGLQYDAALVLLNADGTLDLNFDADGYRLYDVGNSSQESSGALTQLSNGAIILGGYTKAVNSDYDLLLFKLTPLINSIEPSEALSSISLYPNPAGQELTLTFELAENSTLNFDIVDASGRIAASKQLDLVSGKQQVRFNDQLSNLEAGIYLMNYRSNASTGAIYFIKK